MTASRVVDVHAHAVSEQALQILTRDSPGSAPRLDGVGDGPLKLSYADQVFMIPRAAVDVESRIGVLDASGIDVQVLSPLLFDIYREEGPRAVAFAAAQNDGIAADVAQAPTRLMGLGALPMQVPEDAATELARIMTQLGLRGAIIGCEVGGRNLDDPVLDPLWAAADRLRAFLLIHPQHFRGGIRLDNYHLHTLIGDPLDTTIAAGSLVFGTVTTRFPNIKFCLCNGGGFVPYQVARFSQGWERRTEPREKLNTPPRDLLHAFYFDSVLHSSRALRFVTRSFGASHVLLGTDFPGDEAALDAVSCVEQAGLGADEAAAVLGGSALRLLGAPTPAH